VSWNVGAACDGEGCGWEHRNAEKIDRLEFHTSWGHYSELGLPSGEVRGGANGRSVLQEQGGQLAGHE
jgi:hypothetical protein